MHSALRWGPCAGWANQLRRSRGSAAAPWSRSVLLLQCHLPPHLRITLASIPCFLLHIFSFFFLFSLIAKYWNKPLGIPLGASATQEHQNGRREQILEILACSMIKEYKLWRKKVCYLHSGQCDNVKKTLETQKIIQRERNKNSCPQEVMIKLKAFLMRINRNHSLTWICLTFFIRMETNTRSALIRFCLDIKKFLLEGQRSLGTRSQIECGVSLPGSFQQPSGQSLALIQWCPSLEHEAGLETSWSPLSNLGALPRGFTPSFCETEVCRAVSSEKRAVWHKCI